MNIEQALAACDGYDFDCAIVDYRLPGQDGLAGITALHERLPFMAILMSTGYGDEIVATEAMKRGASNYIPKSKINAESIRRIIEHGLQNAKLRRKLDLQREDLENFARLMVHDFKSPAASILGFADQIECKLRDLDQAVVYSGRIAQAAGQMSQLLDALYQYTRADATVSFDSADMNRVFEDTLVNLQQLIMESRALITGDSLPTIVANAPQLMQLLQNLIVNGIKYCAKPVAQIHLSASKQTAPESDEDFWLFSIQDNGIGIPERHYQKVFDPFKRMNGAKSCDGSGLGLATCRRSSSAPTGPSSS